MVYYTQPTGFGSGGLVGCFLILHNELTLTCTAQAGRSTTIARRVRICVVFILDGVIVKRAQFFFRDRPLKFLQL